ncbi:MAG: site-2 protease family protein, partial [Candidatus Omnitrophica bacterium]|nr:site-2 protease family protein [Candidatus Omnitrophota bacterium]
MSDQIPVPHCPECHTTIAPGLLVCPGCKTLVYRDRLAWLQQQASACEQRGEGTQALQHWREALHLLPPDSRQFLAVHQKIDALRPHVDTRSREQAEHHKKIPKPLIALGALGLVVWKLKFIVVLLLTKAKVLFLGLTKAQTFLTMFLSFGVYWTAWGWKFALGLVLSIY